MRKFSKAEILVEILPRCVGHIDNACCNGKNRSMRLSHLFQIAGGEVPRTDEENLLIVTKNSNFGKGIPKIDDQPGSGNSLWGRGLTL